MSLFNIRTREWREQIKQNNNQIRLNNQLIQAVRILQSRVTKLEKIIKNKGI